MIQQAHLYTPKARDIVDTKVGDSLMVADGDRYEQYKVLNVYPYHVIAQGEDGKKKSFNVGDLVKIGKEASNGMFIRTEKPSYCDYD